MQNTRQCVELHDCLRCYSGVFRNFICNDDMYFVITFEKTACCDLGSIKTYSVAQVLLLCLILLFKPVFLAIAARVLTGRK